MTMKVLVIIALWIGAVPLHGQGLRILGILNVQDGTYSKGEEVKLTVRMDTDADEDQSGELLWTIYRDTRVPVDTIRHTLSVPSGQQSILNLAFTPNEPGFYFGNFEWRSEQVNQLFDTLVRFGYEIEQIRSQAMEPGDLKSFWDTSRKSLARVKPAYKLIPQDSLSDETKTVYLVEMRSFGNVRIRGWYTVPAGTGTYPAILKTQGYSATNRPVLNVADFAVFSLNIRGHGNSRDDVNPGFPGFLTHGLESKETYIYRGAYMDCVRAVDFLSSRPEVDKNRIVVQGESQGGGLAFALAALDSRVDLCVVRVPFLSDFRTYLEIVNSSAFASFAKEKGKSLADVFAVLDYFDVSNLSGRIQVPVFMSVGLQDMVCPNHINFAVYNAATSARKEYVIFPQTGHRMWEAIGSLDTNWIRTQFGMPVPR
jgi:cephalosporin-C deacetylase-like acetyl esterase